MKNESDGKIRKVQQVFNLVRTNFSGQKQEFVKLALFSCQESQETLIITQLLSSNFAQNT